MNGEGPRGQVPEVHIRRINVLKIDAANHDAIITGMTLQSAPAAPGSTSGLPLPENQSKLFV